MKVVIQRVTEATVSTDNIVIAKIDYGILLLVGIENLDNSDDIEWLVTKISNLRIFNDSNGVMNLNINDVNGGMIIVSQFTLQASTKKGNRPSYLNAAKPEIAIPIYEQFVSKMQTLLETKIHTGKFGADMKVQLINDGPVTIIIDSKNKV
jgi:D-tyrosyl-tRNA(Tyr) deacylase